MIFGITVGAFAAGVFASYLIGGLMLRPIHDLESKILQTKQGPNGDGPREIGLVSPFYRAPGKLINGKRRSLPPARPRAKATRVSHLVSPTPANGVRH